MKKLSTILLAVILAGLTAVNAQAPRVRSSAPVEKTAQKGAPAPKVKSAGKSGGKRNRRSLVGRCSKRH